MNVRFLCACLIVFAMTSSVTAQAARLLDDAGKLPENVVVVYPILGQISSSSYSQLKREVDRLVDELGVRVLVFEISSPGGELQAGQDTASYIFDLHRNRGVDVYAYIATKTYAYSAAALIALAAPTIVMGENSRIGDIIPIDGFTGRELGEKIQSVVRADVAYYAEQNNYPVAVAEGMVSPKLKVYELKRGNIDGARFVTSGVLENYFENNPGARSEIVTEVASDVDQVLVLSENEAFKYDIANKISPSIDHMITDYGLSGEILRVPQDFDNMGAKVTDAPWARWLDYSFIKFLLIVIGIIGIALEFKMPTTMIPGGIGLAAFFLFFLGGWANGNVEWIEITLFVAAGVLVACEIFVIPGFGIAGFTGLGMLFASLVMSLRPTGTFTADQFVDDSLLVVGSLAASMFGIIFVLWALPRFGIGSTSFVGTATLESGATIPGAPEASYDFLKEKTGVARTACRPSGKAMIDNREFDVVADRGFIDRNAAIEVVEVQGNRIVIREVR